MKTTCWNTALFILAIALVSCQRTELPYPSVEDLYGEITVKQDFTISHPEIDFLAGDRPFFTFALGRKANWQITITDSATGKRCTLQDSSNGANQKNSTWLGTGTTPPSFGVGTCTAVFSLPNHPEILPQTLKFKIKSASKVDAQGILVADFSLGPNRRFASGGSDAAINGIRQIAGVNAWRIEGIDNDEDYTIGRVDLKVRDANFRNIGTYDIIETDPEKVWFNVYVYSDDFKASLVEVTFQENERADSLFPGYQSTRDDAFKFMLFKPAAPGWSLISIRYSDLLFPDQNYRGPNIVADPTQRPKLPWNGIKNPERVSIVNVKVQANPRQPGALTFGYCNFTLNGPLKYN